MPGGGRRSFLRHEMASMVVIVAVREREGSNKYRDSHDNGSSNDEKKKRNEAAW